MSVLTQNHCDTMWVVHQVDDFFVCFGAKPNKGLSLRSSMSLEVGEEKLVQEKPERSWQKEPREGQLAKGNPERVSWWRETQRGSWEWTAEGTSQDELAVQSG